MKDLAEKLADVIAQNGGEIVGRTRLQKVFYLLEARGIGFGLAFDYHHYGPYSEELALAADDAQAMGYLRTEQRQGFHEVPYTVFKVTVNVQPQDKEDATGTLRAKYLKIMEGYSALVLELAATVVFLKDHGYPDSHWMELKRRKGTKVTDRRLEQVKRLLTELDMPV